MEGSDEINPLHGSDNPDKAASEVNFFFPVEHTFCAIKPHMDDRGIEWPLASKGHCIIASSFSVEAILNKIKESGFNVSLSSETMLTKEMAEQLYNNQRDKEYFEDLVTMMTRQAKKLRSLEAKFIKLLFVWQWSIHVHGAVCAGRRDGLACCHGAH